MNDDKINNDYDYSRDTLYELIEKGKDALENMIEVARESEHPRAYEVLSGLIKNVADVNDKLQDLNKKQKQLLPKFFYDERGSKLFNKITNLKEYYPTKKELEILSTYKSEIGNRLPKDSTVVEFGSGSNKKINQIFSSLFVRYYFYLSLIHI